MPKVDRRIALLTVGVALAGTLPILANLWWGFDLFSHFRLQYLFLLSALFLINAGRRRWWLAWTLLPVSIISGVPVYENFAAPENPVVAGQQLSVMSVNVQAENGDIASLVGMLREQLPDLVVVVEYNATWQTGLAQLNELYPHRIEAPQHSRFGIALLSRIPLKESKTFDLVTTTAVTAEVELDGQSVSILGVHLRSPVSAQLAHERNQQLDELGGLLADRSDPTIIVGDFNITAYSPIFSRWLADNRLRSAFQTSGFGISWPTYLPLLGILIDHCVLSDEFIISNYSRGPHFGSDHYPVTCTISLRGAS
ncbi:MAG: endonuclease/exonuclease/phosphatase family protein [Candidatus Rariloculaceae bacterium]